MPSHSPARFKTDVFERAFSGKMELPFNNMLVKFNLYLMGDLILPSGRIVACDGWEPTNTPPFVIKVKPGSYPAFVCMAEVKGDKRPTFVKIQFSDAAPVEWELAAVEKGKKPEEWGYGVEGGAGCFTSFECNELFNSKIADQFFKNESYSDANNANCFFVAEHGPGNRIIFDSGMGDGEYFSYWGFDKDDNPVQLITDFQVLDWQGKELTFNHENCDGLLGMTTEDFYPGENTTVIITKIAKGMDAAAVKAIRAIRTDLSEAEAKEFIQKLPVNLLENISRRRAMEVLDKLYKAGAHVQLDTKGEIQL